jgi:protein TonB
MSIDAASDWDSDNPWRRLPWTLPGALLLWAAVFAGFAHLIGQPAARLPEPPPIDAQVIELPPPPPPVKPAPLHAAPPPRPAPPQAVPQPAMAQPVAAPPAPAPIMPTPPPIVSAPPPHLPVAPAIPVKPALSSNNATGNSAAQAIVKPMPSIPDDLREAALSTAATARFHIAPDGSATVELLKPTPEPRLNQLLLATLRNWKFFPALRDGKPAASVQDIVVKIDVK